MGAYRIGLIATLAAFLTCPTKQPKLDAMRKQIESGQALLVDVRTTQEWVDGHVTFALHVPLTKLEAGELPINLPKDKILYIHCQVGNRSKKAAAILREDEYECVVPLKYSVEDFRKAGYPIQ